VVAVLVEMEEFVFGPILVAVPKQAFMDQCVIMVCTFLACNYRYTPHSSITLLYFICVVE